MASLEPQITLEPQLCSVREAARALGIGVTKTRQLIAEALLDTLQIGTRRLVTIASIKRLIEAAQDNGAA